MVTTVGAFVDNIMSVAGNGVNWGIQIAEFVGSHPLTVAIFAMSFVGVGIGLLGRLISAIR